MSPQALFRSAAVALAVSGVSLAVGLILHPMPPYSASVATSQWAISHLFWWIGGLAGMTGVLGLYFSNHSLPEEAGRDSLLACLHPARSSESDSCFSGSRCFEPG